MSFIQLPDVSLFLHTDLFGEIHLTTSDALVASGPNVPAFWTDGLRNAADNFAGVWIGIGRCLCIVLSPPRALTSVASVRLWSCVAAPVLILALIGRALLFQPVACSLQLGRKLAGGFASAILKAIVPRSVRWWGDAETPAHGLED